MTAQEKTAASPVRRSYLRRFYDSCASGSALGINGAGIGSFAAGATTGRGVNGCTAIGSTMFRR